MAHRKPLSLNLNDESLQMQMLRKRKKKKLVELYQVGPDVKKKDDSMDRMEKLFLILIGAGIVFLIYSLNLFTPQKHTPAPLTDSQLELMAVIETSTNEFNVRADVQSADLLALLTKPDPEHRANAFSELYQCWQGLDRHSFLKAHVETQFFQVYVPRIIGEFIQTPDSAKKILEAAFCGSSPNRHHL